MKKNIEVLDNIYKTAQMGIIGIDDVLTKITNEQLKDVIYKQLKEYQEICESAKKIYKDYGQEASELGKMAKMNSKMMVEAKCLNKECNKTIAKMMIEGTNKGIIKITTALNNSKKDDLELTKLANQFLKIEQDNIDELKQFL